MAASPKIFQVNLGDESGFTDTLRRPLHYGDYCVFAPSLGGRGQSTPDLYEGRFMGLWNRNRAYFLKEKISEFPDTYTIPYIHPVHTWYVKNCYSTNQCVIIAKWNEPIPESFKHVQ
jgi:hypothetical protein